MVIVCIILLLILIAILLISEDGKTILYHVLRFVLTPFLWIQERLFNNNQSMDDIELKKAQKKVCPKCFRKYDGTWAKCLDDNYELIYSIM